MKNIITTLLILISSLTYSQVIDYDSFDNNLIDSLVFVEINSYRSEINNPELVYSKNLHSGLSKYITGVLVKQQSAGHPDGQEVLNKISDEVSKEINSKFSDKVLTYTIDRYAEVSLKTSKRPEEFTTYQELAIYLVTLWKNSPGHDLIIQSWASIGDGVIGVASGSVQIGDYDWGGKTYVGIYASFQINYNYIR